MNKLSIEQKIDKGHSKESNSNLYMIQKIFDKSTMKTDIHIPKTKRLEYI